MKKSRPTLGIVLCATFCLSTAATVLHFTEPSVIYSLILGGLSISGLLLVLLMPPVLPPAQMHRHRLYAAIPAHTLQAQIGQRRALPPSVAFPPSGRASGHR